MRSTQKVSRAAAPSNVDSASESTNVSPRSGRSTSVICCGAIFMFSWLLLALVVEDLAQRRGPTISLCTATALGGRRLAGRPGFGVLSSRDDPVQQCPG